MPTFEDFETDTAAPVAKGRSRYPEWERIPPEEQVAKDNYAVGIRGRELGDPKMSEEDKAAIRKDRLLVAATGVPTAKKLGLSFEAFGPMASEAPTPKPASIAAAGLPSSAGDLAAKTGREAIALGDLVLGIPGQLIGIGADIGMRARTIGAGGTRTEQSEAGAAASAKVNEALGQPLAKLLKLAGMESEDSTTVDAAMGKVAEWIGKGGEWVEKNTGGLLNKGDVESITNAAMGAAGGRGLAYGLRKAGGTAGLPLEGVKLRPDALARLADERAGVKAEPAPNAIPPMTEAPAAPAGKTKLTEAVILEKDAAGNLSEAIPPMGEGLPKQATVDAALTKVSEGRAFDMTAEERIAYKGWKDKPLETPLVDEAGRPLESLSSGAIRSQGRYSRQRGAVDFGAFIPRREGEPGLSLAEFEKLSPTLTLGSLLQRSDYTLKTLDRLPQNKTEFSRAHIEQELKRADVTDAERGAVQAALDQFPGQNITAKALMVGVKRATGDFELTPKLTDQYADYGLDSIRDFDPDATPLAGEKAPTTTLYRLPEHLTLSDANHFQDPNLFGWTRSFTEEGKRHVVEIQSDLAQHAGKPLEPEARAGLLAEQKRVEASHAALDKILTEWNTDNPKISNDMVGEARKAIFDATREMGPMGPSGIPGGRIQTAFKRLGLQLDEIATKLGAGDTSKVAPILKNWPKRLVREELAQAAEAGEPAVRFATADTVTKVEGWPEQVTYKEGAKTEVPGLEGHRTPGTRLGRLNDFVSDGGVFVRDGQLYESGHNVDVTGRRLARDSIRAVPNLSPEIVKPLIEKTGLRPEHQSIYDRYRRDIEKFTTQLGGKPVTDAQGHTWIEVPTPKRGPKQMFGRADTELIKPLAGAMAGAALGMYLDREPGDTGLGGAVLGSIAGAAALSRGGAKFAAEGVKLADRGLGLLSTRIGNISEPVLHRAREFERRVLGDTHRRLEATDPLITELKKAKSPALERAIKTNDPAETTRLMPPSMKAAWAQTRAVLDEVGEKLRSAGLLSDLRSDYFPRIVKDRAGLLKSLGSEERAGLQQALLDANTRAAKAGQGALDIAEESAVINKFLEGQARKAKPGFTKARVLEEVIEATDPFYATNAEALHTYLASATQAIERARFFGKDLVTKTEDGRTTVDLNSSVGRVVQRELESGKIDPRQAEDLSEMLRARFESRPQAGVVQDVKNAANLGLLGNIISAGTQLGDLATAVYMEGLRPSLEALGRSLSRSNRITIKDFGLVDHISEEFSSTRGTAKVLNAAFRLSGFAAVDALGKNVLLNAALSKFQRLAKTAAGERAIAKRFSKSFGDDTPALVDELRSGKVGEQTRAMLFQELSKAQPISKLEVPQSYLEMPNGRLLYMLKTFMLKQADIVRRDAYNEIKAGHKAVGLANLTKYALALGISGMATDAVKNWLLGRPIDLSPTNLALNMVKTFGFSQYVLDKVRQGKPMEAVGGVVAPPYKMMDDIIRDNSAASRYVPIVGPLLYSHVFGGADKEQAKAGAAAKKAGQPRTPEQIAAAKRLKEKRRLERKARKANP